MVIYAATQKIALRFVKKLNKQAAWDPFDPGPPDDEDDDPIEELPPPNLEGLIPQPATRGMPQRRPTAKSLIPRQPDSIREQLGSLGELKGKLWATLFQLSNFVDAHPTFKSLKPDVEKMISVLQKDVNKELDRIIDKIHSQEKETKAGVASIAKIAETGAARLQAQRTHVLAIYASIMKTARQTPNAQLYTILKRLSNDVATYDVGVDFATTTPLRLLKHAAIPWGAVISVASSALALASDEDFRGLISGVGNKIKTMFSSDQTDSTVPDAVKEALSEYHTAGEAFKEALKKLEDVLRAHQASASKM